MDRECRDFRARKVDRSARWESNRNISQNLRRTHALRNQTFGPCLRPVAFASFCSAATISGTVKGPDGTPFEGAFVGAQNSKTKITVSALSDKQGHYQVTNLRCWRL